MLPSPPPLQQPRYLRRQRQEPLRFPRIVWRRLCANFNAAKTSQSASNAAMSLVLGVPMNNARVAVLGTKILVIFMDKFNEFIELALVILAF
nr:uncharacterized protein LOC112801486 isoform X2 [Arachis hypogaea]